MAVHELHVCQTLMEHKAAAVQTDGGPFPHRS